MDRIPADQWWIYAFVIGFGLASLLVVMKLVKPGSGFGPFNLRAVGMVLVATFATVVTLWTGDASASMAILGAVAGYLFGLKDQL